MDIKQVRHVLALYKFGTFTRAAQAVNITQPTLTESIKKLEDQLGGALFLRDRAGCQPTALGKTMLPRFERIAAEFDDALDAAKDFVQLRRVPLRIGVLNSIGMERLAPCLAQHQNEKPEIEIEVLVSTHDELCDGLASGYFDLGIGSAGELETEQFRCHDLYSEGYVLAFPHDHHLSAEETISLKQLENEVLLDRPKCEMRDKLMGICSGSNISLYAPHRTNSISLLKLQVQAGVGVAVLPRYSLERDHPHIAARPLGLADFTRDILAVRHIEQTTRPEVHALLTTVQRTLRAS